MVLNFTGLIGGGGSILAVPLFIYFVGINHPHLAIGTTASENADTLSYLVCFVNSLQSSVGRLRHLLLVPSG